MSLNTQIIVSAKDYATSTYRKIGLSTESLRQKVFSLQGAFAGLGGALVARKALQSFSQLEQGLVEVQKTTGLTDDELQVLQRRIQDMALETPVAVQGLLGIAGAAGQIGVKGVDNIELFTEVLAKMQVASDIVGTEGAKSLARLLNTAGEGTDKIDELGSAIVALGNDTAASESEIVKVASEVGRATAAYEVSSEAAVAYGAALKGMGARAELSGSAIGRMMITMDKALSAGGEELRAFTEIANMSAAQFRETFEQDAAEALNAVLHGMDRMVRDEGAKTVQLLESIGLSGVETVKGLSPLIANIDQLDKAFALANKEIRNATALNQEALAASKSFSSQMQMTLNAVDQIAAGIGEGLAPAIVRVTGDFRDWVDENQDFIQQELPNHIADVADSFGELGTAVGDFVTSPEFDALKEYWELIAGAAAGAYVGGPLGALVGAGAGGFWSAAKDAKEAGWLIDTDADESRGQVQSLRLELQELLETRNRILSAIPEGDDIIDYPAQKQGLDDVNNAIKKTRAELNALLELQAKRSSPGQALQPAPQPQESPREATSRPSQSPGLAASQVPMDLIRDTRQWVEEELERWRQDGNWLSEDELMRRQSSEVQNKWNQRRGDNAAAEVAAMQRVYDEQERAAEQAQRAATQTFSFMDEMSRQTARNMQSNFSTIFYDGMKGELDSFGDLFSSFADSLLRTWADVQAQMLARNMFGEAFMSGDSSNMGGWVGQLGSAVAGMFHSGGVVGQSAVASRSVPATAYAGAPRLHNGFMPGEYPAILKRGESVLTPEQMRAMGSRQAPNVEVNVINRTGEKADARRGDMKFDGEKWVMNVVLDAANRNRSGFGKNLNAALSKSR